MGSDLVAYDTPLDPLNFNPRSPHGERRKLLKKVSLVILFQSTLPAWGATITGDSLEKVKEFQSTLPAWGATLGL